MPLHLWKCAGLICNSAPRIFVESWRTQAQHWTRCQRQSQKCTWMDKGFLFRWKSGALSTHLMVQLQLSKTTAMIALEVLMNLFVLIIQWILDPTMEGIQVPRKHCAACHIPIYIVAQPADRVITSSSPLGLTHPVCGFLRWGARWWSRQALMRTDLSTGDQEMLKPSKHKELQML